MGYDGGDNALRRAANLSRSPIGGTIVAGYLEFGTGVRSELVAGA